MIFFFPDILQNLSLGKQLFAKQNWTFSSLVYPPLPPCISIELPFATILPRQLVVYSLQSVLILNINHSGLLIAVVPGCGEGAVGEVYNCVLDWLIRESQHSVLSPFPPSFTSSLPFLLSWEIVWIFKRSKKIIKPLFFCFPQLSQVLQANWDLQNFCISPRRNESGLTCQGQILR